MTVVNLDEKLTFHASYSDIDTALQTWADEVRAAVHHGDVKEARKCLHAMRGYHSAVQAFAGTYSELAEDSESLFVACEEKVFELEHGRKPDVPLAGADRERYEKDWQRELLPIHSDGVMAMNDEALNAYKAGLADDLDKSIAETLEAERKELEAEGYEDAEMISVALESTKHELEIRKAGILQGFEYGVGFTEHVAHNEYP